jgi:hypothetical protein
MYRRSASGRFHVKQKWFRGPRGGISPLRSLLKMIRVSACALGRRKKIAAASYRANYGGARWVRLDLAAKPHDPKIDGAVKSFPVPDAGEVEQALARENALRIGRKDF